jgi:hypothetical protein
MIKPLLRMGCDINPLDNEMHMARAKLKAVMALRDAIEVGTNNDLKRPSTWIPGQSIAIAAWAVRQPGGFAKARIIAAAALAPRPTSAHAWHALGVAQWPQWRSQTPERMRRGK